MHFLLQSNLVNEEDQAPYIVALEATQRAHPERMSWSFVKLIPFVGTIEPEADYGPWVFPIGSTSMLQASERYGWRPGVVYDPATFQFNAWRSQWGAANLINGDAEVTLFGKAKVLSDATEAFVRPVRDLKEFTGLVITGAELEAWQERVWNGGQSSADSPLLTMETPVIVAPVKTITREWRTWVVGGRVVAASQYALFGKRERSIDAPLDVLLFARRLVDYWRPADVFVLDIGELEDGSLGVVEVNTLNSSGIYMGDMVAVYSSIVRLYT